MKANYGKMIIGVIIGIMAALTLTLNIWGTEWYKLITSTVVGLIIGMLISDYQVTVAIFKTGLQTAANNSWRRAERIKNGEVSPEQQHEFDISVIKWLYGLLIFISAVFIVIVLIICIVLLQIKDTRYSLLMITIGMLFIRLVFRITCSLEFENWTKTLNEQQAEKIWNKKPNEHGKNSLTYDYQKDKHINFNELTADMSLKEIIDRALMSAKVVMKSNLSSDWDNIRSFFRVFAVMILAVILFITTSLPVLPFWIINQISKHGHLLNVAAAITIGSVIGTLTHSQLIGLGSGLGFLAIGYLIDKLFKEIRLFYMFRNDSVFYRLAQSV